MLDCVCELRTRIKLPDGLLDALDPRVDLGDRRTVVINATGPSGVDQRRQGPHGHDENGIVSGRRLNGPPWAHHVNVAAHAPAEPPPGFLNCPAADGVAVQLVGRNSGYQFIRGGGSEPSSQFGSFNEINAFVHDFIARLMTG
jgi:hypothetical protein